MKIADVHLQVEMDDEQDCDHFCEMVDGIGRLMISRGKWVGLKADYVENFTPPPDFVDNGTPAKDAN